MGAVLGAILAPDPPVATRSYRAIARWRPGNFLILNDNVPRIPQEVTHLQIQGRAVTAIPPLPPSLAQLLVLNTQVTQLPELPRTLTYLNCCYNSFSELPALPRGLTQLYANDNQLQELPELPRGLTILHVNNNQLLELPKLPESLRNLECYTNQLKKLPPLPRRLRYLCCFDNPLPSGYNRIRWRYCKPGKKTSPARMLGKSAEECQRIREECEELNAEIAQEGYIIEAEDTDALGYIIQDLLNVWAVRKYQRESEDVMALVTRRTAIIREELIRVASAPRGAAEI